MVMVNVFVSEEIHFKVQKNKIIDALSQKKMQQKQKTRKHSQTLYFVVSRLETTTIYSAHQILKAIKLALPHTCTLIHWWHENSTYTV